MLNDVGTGSLQQFVGNSRFTPRQSPAEIPDEMIDPALRYDRGLHQSTSQNDDGQSDDSSRKSSAMSTSDRYERDRPVSDDEEGDREEVDGWGATNRRETSHPGTLFHIAGIPAHEICRLFS